MLRRAMPIFKGLPVCFQVPENQKKLDVQRNFTLPGLDRNISILFPFLDRILVVHTHSRIISYTI